MKKLFFLLVFTVISSALFAQPRSLIVQNLTNCTQYYMVFGDELCICGTTYTGSFNAIAPGATITYMNSRTLGGTFPTLMDKSIVGARIPSGPIVCNPSAGVVGEPVCGFPTVFSYVSFTLNCTPCSRSTARWFPATNCGQARLIFTP